MLTQKKQELSLLLDFYCKSAAFADSTFDRYRAARHIYHTLDERQSQAVALHSVRGVTLIEFIENMPTRFLVDSAACIGHFGNCKAVFGVKPDRYPAAA